jgi:Tol biopolymer transport system component
MKHNGYRPSWSYKSNLIVYDKKQADGFYHIYTMKPDGSEEICLTDTSIFPAGHKGCTEWHPSDEYLVFTCQKEHYYGKRIPILRNMLDKLAVPGEGINCDLWIMDKNGSQCWQLTDLPTKKSYVDPQAYTGVIHPHFSHDGTKLFWSERIAGGGEDWGEWILRIADFKVVDHIPIIENVVSYQPGVIPCFYESHGFSPDDSKIIFSGNLIAGQDVNHLDIYTLEMQTQGLVRLTTSKEEWDEHAHFSPDGQKIIWMSSEGYGMNTERDWWNYLRTEYWIMNHDGSNKTQISFYNDDIAETMRVICSDCSWSPDGKHIASTMLIQDNEVSIDGGIGILNVLN